MPNRVPNFPTPVGLAKVDRSGEHHLWLGAVATNGIGQVRVDGKLVTAPRVAYELEHGPLASGLRVLTCPAEPGCVRVDHLRVERHGANKPAERRKRAARGAGSIEAMSRGVWKISVSAGVDSDGQRRRTSRTVRGTRSDAAKALAALVTEVGDGADSPARPTNCSPSTRSSSGT